MLSPIDKDLSWIDTAEGEYFYQILDARAQEIGVSVKRFAKIFGLSFFNLYKCKIENERPDEKTRVKIKRVFGWLRRNSSILNELGGPCLT